MLCKKKRNLNRKVPSDSQRKLGILRVGVVLGALVALLALIGALGVSEHQGVQSVNSTVPIVEPEQQVTEEPVSEDRDVISNGVASKTEIKQDEPASGTSEPAPSSNAVIASYAGINTTKET